MITAVVFAVAFLAWASGLKKTAFGENSSIVTLGGAFIGAILTLAVAAGLFPRLRVSGLSPKATEHLSEQSGYKNIELFVRGPLKTQLFTGDAEFSSIQVIGQSLIDSPKNPDLSMYQLWAIHVVAEESIAGQRIRTSHCIGLSSDKRVEHFKILARVDCNANLSPQDQEAFRVQNEQTALQIKKQWEQDP